MTIYDCFNGDADGICALTQLRLHDPQDSQLITGVKRDISLLDRVQVEAGDLVNVLDVSLDKNRVPLTRILAEGAQVFYCDHHFSGDIPEHANLNVIINTTPNVCTSLLINKELQGQFLEWAIVGVFGDNLTDVAIAMAKPLSLKAAQLDQLKKLGVYLNYNGYGATIDDLHFDPAVLFQRASKFATASDFLKDDRFTYQALEDGYHEDIRSASAEKPVFERSHVAVFELPEKAWARRVVGVFSNELANTDTARAHAVLTARSDGDYAVSVRAPLENKRGADEICRQFPTGGGRAAAAGINQLPSEMKAEFIQAFSEFYS